ncbi:hypothetical protein D3C71_77300 [compost metagenome]
MSAKPLLPLGVLAVAAQAAGGYALTTYQIPATYYALVVTGSWLPFVGFCVYLLLWVLKRMEYSTFDTEIRERWRAARDFERRGLVSALCSSEEESREIFLQEKAWRDAQSKESQRPVRWLF